jgi:hypothetical protein
MKLSRAISVKDVAAPAVAPLKLRLHYGSSVPHQGLPDRCYEEVRELAKVLVRRCPRGILVHSTAAVRCSHTSVIPAVLIPSRLSSPAMVHKDFFSWRIQRIQLSTSAGAVARRLAARAMAMVSLALGPRAFTLQSQLSLLHRQCGLDALGDDFPFVFGHDGENLHRQLLLANGLSAATKSTLLLNRPLMNSTSRERRSSVLMTATHGIGISVGKPHLKLQFEQRGSSNASARAGKQLGSPPPSISVYST